MIESFAQRDFGGADLGDRRLDARLVRMGTAAMARPDASLPKMMSTNAELEATYRFVNQPQLRPEQVLARMCVRGCGAAGNSRRFGFRTTRPTFCMEATASDRIWGGCGAPVRHGTRCVRFQ